MYRIIKLNSMACLLPGLNKLIKCKSFVNIILSFSSYDLDLKYSSIFGGAVDFSAYISQLPQWVQKCECHIIFIASRNSISMAVCGPPNGYSPNCCHYHCLATYRHRYASTYRHTHTHTHTNIFCRTACNSLSRQLFLLLLGNQFYINISRWHLVGYFFVFQIRHTLPEETL